MKDHTPSDYDQTFDDTIQSMRVDNPDDVHWQRAHNQLEQQLQKNSHQLFFISFSQILTTRKAWVVAGACMIFVMLMSSDFVSPPTPSRLAYSDVVEKILNIESYAFTCEMISEGEVVITQNIYSDKPGRRRVEYTDQATQVIDLHKRQIMLLFPTLNRCVFRSIGEETDVSTILKKRNGFFALLQELNKAEKVSLFERQIDGVDAHGYRMYRDHIQYEIWLDDETGLPVQVDIEIPNDSELDLHELKIKTGADDWAMSNHIDYQSGVPLRFELDSMTAIQLHFTDFQFNTNFEEKLFSLTHPKDYEVSDMRGLDEMQE